jgi:16S rRNA (cytosine1402-N4)-methyltransferase
MIHVPVMLEEVLGLLRPQSGRIFVDCTLGLGGHAQEILLRASEDARLIGIDKDEDSLAQAKENLARFGNRVIFIKGDFRNLPEMLAEQGIAGADGIIFDLGVSSPQLDRPERGFSYQHDAPLDMRMDKTGMLTASDIVNGESKEQLRRIIFEYGEERWGSRIAEFIVAARQRKPIETTFELVEVIKAAIPAGARREGPHPAKRTFQALRIAVNDELGAIEEALLRVRDAMVPGGRVLVISFHSLEDRIVKQTFRRMKDAGKFELITRKPIIADASEIERNPRARSAKLRAAQRVEMAGEGEGFGSNRAD